jgi:hypothetical protein
MATQRSLIYRKMVHCTIDQNKAKVNHNRSCNMKPAANFIHHLLCRLRSQLQRFHHHAHDVGMAAAQREHNAARILHSSVIRMRSRLQSL